MSEVIVIVVAVMAVVVKKGRVSMISAYCIEILVSWSCCTEGLLTAWTRLIFCLPGPPFPTLG